MKQLLPCLLVCLWGCHAILPLAEPTKDEPPVSDLSQDMPRLDLLDLDLAVDLATPDQGPPTNLACSPPALLDSPGVKLIEPAVDLEGTLVAQQMGSPNAIYCLYRKDAVSFDFDFAKGWETCYSHFAGVHFDLNFYKRQGSSFALATTTAANPRRIYKCDSPSTGKVCVELVDISPPIPTDDHADGPDIRQNPANGQEEIYISYEDPDASGVVQDLHVLLGASITGPLKRLELTELNLPGARQDDASIHPAGTVIVFPSDRNGTWDLFYALRKEGAGTPEFQAPKEISGVNDLTAGDDGVELAVTTRGGQTQLELFFHSTRGSGDQKIYRSECELK